MLEYLQELLQDIQNIDIKEQKQKSFALETAIDILLKLRNEKG
jgi:hypothetical protein